MNWENQSTKSTFDAAANINSQISEREASRTSSSVKVKSQYSVVGLNVGEVTNMCNAIDDYVRDLMAHLDGINPSADSSSAFLGPDVQREVQDYVNKVKRYCMNLTSDLKAFSDKLVDVRNAWEAGQRNIASGVNASKASFNEGKEYERQMQ